MIKHIMIPAALFAVTATTVSAFDSNFLRRLDVNLSEQQINALSEARDLRHAGEFRAARERLEEASVTVETMRDIHEAVHSAHAERRGAVLLAVKANKYAAFRRAVAGAPMSEIVDTSEKFDAFVRAYHLQVDGQYEAARSILTELGFSANLNLHQGPRHGVRLPQAGE